jgi:hypothetical protein
MPRATLPAAVLKMSPSFGAACWENVAAAVARENRSPTEAMSLTANPSRVADRRLRR